MLVGGVYLMMRYLGEVMMVQNELSVKIYGVILIEVVVVKVKLLLDQEGWDDLVLWIVVQLGGCVGLCYNFFFDDWMLDGD